MLVRINDKEIFTKYFGEFDFSKSYPSVFRSDTNPSTGFFNNNGKIIYNDFSTGEKLDSVSFVMKRFNLNRGDALKKIHKEASETAPVVQAEKEEVWINVVPRPFLKDDLDYFDKFNISQFELEKNNVYSVKEFLIKGHRIVTPQGVQRFAYILKSPDGPFVKIYSPNSPTHKWISNIPLNQPFGLDDLKTTKRLIITKSLKDKMVLDKFFPDVLGLQNESSGALKYEDAIMLKERYEQVYIGFDIDPPGLKAVQYYKDNFGFIPIIMPDVLYSKYGVKDFSDFVARFGIDRLKNMLEWMKLK